MIPIPGLEDVGIRTGDLSSIAAPIQKVTALRPFFEGRVASNLDFYANGMAKSDVLGVHFYLLVGASLGHLAANTCNDFARASLELASSTPIPLPTLPNGPPDEPKSHWPILSLNEHVAMAIAPRALDARPPVAETLSGAARGVFNLYSTYRGKLHPLEQVWHVTALFCALVAGDLDMARALAKLRRSFNVSPRVFPLLQALAAKGRMAETPFGPAIRLPGNELRNTFLELFANYRRRLAWLPVDHEELGCFTPLSGLYMWSWLYLKSFGPTELPAIDWPVLRKLMVG